MGILAGILQNGAIQRCLHLEQPQHSQLLFFFVFGVLQILSVYEFASQLPTYSVV